MEPLRFASRSTLKGPGIFDRPGEPGVGFGAILALAGRAVYLGAARLPAGSTSARGTVDQ